MKLIGETYGGWKMPVMNSLAKIAIIDKASSFNKINWNILIWY